MKKAIVTYGLDDRITKKLLVGGLARDAAIFEGPTVTLSDGYHTMDELYDHRITLFLALATLLKRQENAIGSVPAAESFVWRSRLHHDGTSFEGQFILGIGKEMGHQITYHLPLSRWEETNFAETLDRGPEWDGHTPADVLERLKKL
jgi:hypothetical protein